MNKIERLETGVSIRKSRDSIHITQKEAARLLGVSLVSYRRAEEGNPLLSESLLKEIEWRAKALEKGSHKELLEFQLDSLRHWEEQISSIRQYMNTHNCLAEQAMTELDIPESERAILIALTRKDTRVQTACKKNSARD